MLYTKYVYIFCKEKKTPIKKNNIVFSITTDIYLSVEKLKYFKEKKKRKSKMPVMDLWDKKHNGLK